jgi:hypothetical protein
VDLRIGRLWFGFKQDSNHVFLGDSSDNDLRTTKLCVEKVYGVPNSSQQSTNARASRAATEDNLTPPTVIC